jgi:hypothetical protein
MGKLRLWLLLSVAAFGQVESLENDCLSCHKAQQIPSAMIYKRYLMKYSIAKNIEEAMLLYIKNPQKSTSIMPTQFFLKFPMKNGLKREEQRLQRNIKAYIEKFDVKKKLQIHP